MTCPCEGLKGVGLAVCISPPPGEHEVDIPISSNRSIVINDEGVFVRQVVLDDSLPFARTSTRRVDPGFLGRIAVGIDESSIVCRAAESLVEAYREGSLAAGRKLEACRGLVERLLSECPSRQGTLDR